MKYFVCEILWKRNTDMYVHTHRHNCSSFTFCNKILNLWDIILFSKEKSRFYCFFIFLFVVLLLLFVFCFMCMCALGFDFFSFCIQWLIPRFGGRQPGEYQTSVVLLKYQCQTANWKRFPGCSTDKRDPWCAVPLSSLSQAPEMRQQQWQSMCLIVGMADRHY